MTYYKMTMTYWSGCFSAAVQHDSAGNLNIPLRMPPKP